MRIRSLAILGFAVAASLCMAQPMTRIINEVSTDNGHNWSSLAEVLPGATVQVRIRVEFVGTQTVMGLAGIVYQPTLSAWRPEAGDLRVRFTNEETGAGAPDLPESLGRLFPYASAGQGPTSPSGLLTSHNDPGGVLRFAGSRALSMTANLAWGVGSAKAPRAITQPPCDLPPYDCETGRVFKYAVTLSATSTDPREMIAAVPIAGILGGRSNWYTTESGLNSLVAPVTPELVQSAVIRVVPVPASAVAMCGGLAAAFARRRRRACGTGAKG